MKGDEVFIYTDISTGVSRRARRDVLARLAIISLAPSKNYQYIYQ